MRSALLQPDLFGAPPVPVPPVAPPRTIVDIPAPVPPLPVPARVPAWDACLARSPAAATVRVLVTTRWTGLCLEVLSCPVQGRLWLDSTGAIRTFLPDSVHGRIVYATPAMARAWHTRRALVLARPPGTGCAEFHFATAAGADPLQFPPPFQE